MNSEWWRGLVKRHLWFWGSLCDKTFPGAVQHTSDYSPQIGSQGRTKYRYQKVVPGEPWVLVGLLAGTLVRRLLMRSEITQRQLHFHSLTLTLAWVSVIKVENREHPTQSAEGVLSTCLCWSKILVGSSTGLWVFSATKIPSLWGLTAFTVYSVKEFLVSLVSLRDFLKLFGWFTFLSKELVHRTECSKLGGNCYTTKFLLGYLVACLAWSYCRVLSIELTWSR